MRRQCCLYILNEQPKYCVNLLASCGHNISRNTNQLLIVTAVDNGMARRSKTTTSEFHLIIAKSSSFRCGDRFLESRTEFPDRVAKCELLEQSTVFLLGLQLYFSRGYNSISLGSTTVFLPFCQNCTLFTFSTTFCISPSLRLDRVADSWRSLIGRWIMLERAQTDSSRSTDHLVGHGGGTKLFYQVPSTLCRTKY